MRRAFCLLLLICLPAVASAAFVPSAPDIKARSYVLMDYASGQILASRKPELKTPPASLTKLMTLYVTFRQLKKGRISLDTKFLISKNAWLLGVNGGASRMFLTVGDRVPVKLLIQGVIVDSGNDAATALGEGIAGSINSFVGVMNSEAKKLGMKQSHFINADGLPADMHSSSTSKANKALPQDVVSAEDLAILARAIIHDFPKYYPFFSQKEFTYDKIKQYNRVHLLFADPSVDGLKTGFTDAAGYCLLASAKRKGRRLIAVVMGTPSEKYRNIAVEQLLNYGFHFFETDKLLGKANPALKLRIYQGDVEKLPVGTLQPVYLGVPRGSNSKLKIVSDVKTPLVAPIKAGAQVGSAQIQLDGKTLKHIPLVALQSVSSGGFFHNAADQVRLWMSN